MVNRLLGTIRERSGISINDVLYKKLHKIFDSRLESYKESDKWVKHLESLDPTSGEWNAFVESILIHETYFYRDKPQLDDLRFKVVPALILKKMQDRSLSLRIWSAACSTGEEVYTIAFILLEALKKLGEASESFPGEITVNHNWKIEILGTDISWISIMRAKKASYLTCGLSSFRDMPREFDCFFRQKGDEKIMDNRVNKVDRRAKQNYTAANSKEMRSVTSDRRQRSFTSKYLEVRPDAKKLVSFDTHNFFSGKPPGKDYDIILCRNVLIYFDDKAKREVQLMLSDALVPGGYLLLGPPDTLLFPQFFETKRCKSTVYYRKHKI